MALECGLLVKRVARGVAVLDVRGVVAAAKLLGVSALGAVPVRVPATFCAKLPCFKAAAFAAFLEGRNKQTGPISRKTIHSLTGLPERTQRAMAKRGRIRATSNFAKSNIGAGDSKFVEGAGDYRPGAFVIDDGKRKVLAWHLPNSYSTPFKRSPRGALRRTNSLLRYGLLISELRATDGKELQRFSEPQAPKSAKLHRIFWNDRERAEKQREKIEGGRPSAFSEEPRERYFKTRWATRAGARVWQLVKGSNATT